MDYDTVIDERIKMVDEHRKDLLKQLSNEEIPPKLEAQLQAIFEYGNALSYLRQRQADLDRAQEQLAEAADQAWLAHQAFKKVDRIADNS